MAEATANPAVAAILATIPPKQYAKFKDWLVKQVVITKSGATHSGLKMPGVHVKDAPPKLARMGTSKMHKFKPSVSVVQALQWFVEYGAADASLLFDNSCSALFEKGRYSELEDVRDEDDEDGDEEAAHPKQQQTDAADEDDGEEDVKGDTIEGERFRLGDHTKD